MIGADHLMQALGRMDGIGTGLSSFRAYLCCITDEYCETCWLTRFLGVVVKPKRAKRPLPGSS